MRMASTPSHQSAQKGKEDDNFNRHQPRTSTHTRWQTVADGGENGGGGQDAQCVQCDRGKKQCLLTWIQPRTGTHTQSCGNWIWTVEASRGGSLRLRSLFARWEIFPGSPGPGSCRSLDSGSGSRSEGERARALLASFNGRSRGSALERDDAEPMHWSDLPWRM